MVQTRRQYFSSKIKKEEHADEPQLKQLLHSTNNAAKTKNRITKSRTQTQVYITNVKLEIEDDSKALLASTKKKTCKKSNITKKQITKLIGYIVNDKMSVKVASKKVGISHTTAYKYYKEYQDNIPLPKVRLSKSLSRMTQKKIYNLISYIVNDGMTVSQASTKLNIDRRAGAKYYARYLEDPERKIPLLDLGGAPKSYTQEEIADLINYIVRDKMTIVEASNKAGASTKTTKKYYLKYLQDPNHEIPDPNGYKLNLGKTCTNDQVKSLIRYIVSDGMSLMEASLKVNMSAKSASKYYRLYLDDPKKNIPTPKSNDRSTFSSPLRVDQVKNFFRYIIVDRLTVAEAACKSHISVTSGRAYYDKYLKSPNNQIMVKNMTYSAEKMKRFVELVQNEKMSLRKAADTVDVCLKTASKHYHQYLQDPQYEFPESKSKQYTQEEIKMLIDYIERDKESVYSAAKRIKMGRVTALKYYKIYKKDPEHKIPIPHINNNRNIIKASDNYRQIIADIYRDNPSIKPIH